MTAVVETYRKTSVLMEHKIISIKTSSAAATGHTIDLNSDVADGRGRAVKEVINTILQDDAGTDVADCAFDPATGIITLPTITTGIHHITIIAR